MRTVHARIRSSIREAGLRVAGFVRSVGTRLRSRPELVGGFAIAALGTFFWVVPVRADLLQLAVNAATSGPTAWVGLAVTLINALLYTIVELIIQLDIVLTDILINVVQFNTFVNARPVQIGWPLVRDVVNMFFIVVLLIIAFSTIIGYKEFHYKSILPKLLLMAVLINFSKTLVGLMIDFSQVVTLTFVNGFKQAAFGNFAKAFNYDKLLNFNKLNDALVLTGDSEFLQTAGQTMITLLFAIAMMSMVGTVLLIMVIYFIVRIVLLWILLIFSPIAFFVLALPSKMAKAIGPAASGWWQRLGSLLTGGPVVAFFLWLTLATIQGASNPFEGMYKTNTSTAEADQVTAIGLSGAGVAGNFATFLVALIMLMTGLQTAVSISKEAAPKLGDFAAKIKATGGPVGLASRGAAAGARAGARGARVGAALVDKKFNVSGKLGSGLIQAGQRTAAGGGALGRIAGTAMSRAGGRFKAVETERKAGYESALEKRVKHLPPADRLRALAVERQGGGGVFANKEMKDIANIKYGEAMSSSSGMKLRQKELEGQFIARNPGREEEAKAWASGQAKREAGLALADAIKAAEDSGKTDIADKLKGLREKDPSLHASFSDLSKIAANSTDDHATLFKGIKTEAWQDSATFLAMMKATRMTGPDGKSVSMVDEATGKMRDGYQESDTWKELIKNGGNRQKYVEAHAEALRSESGQEAAKIQLAAMSDAGTPQEIASRIAAAEQYRNSGALSADGRSVIFANMAPQGGGGFGKVEMADVGKPTRIDNFDELAAKISSSEKANLQQALQAVGLNEDSIHKMAKRFDRPITTEQASHVRQNAAVYANPPAFAPGATPTDTTQRNQLQQLVVGQSMGIRAPEKAQEHVIRMALESSGSGDIAERQIASSAIANIDVQAIQSSPDVQKAIVDAMEGKIDGLANAFKSIEKSNDPQQIKKIEEVIRTVSKQGQEAMKKAVSGELTDVEARMAKLAEQIGENKVLKKVADRKSRGKKA